MNSNHPLERLRHHVSGAIERGEKEAIVEVTPVARLSELLEKHSELVRDFTYGQHTEAKRAEINARMASIEVEIDLLTDDDEWYRAETGDHF